MEKKFRKNTLFVAIVLMSMLIFIVVTYVGVKDINAQEDYCTDLSEGECAILNISISEWREKFGSSIEFLEVTDVSPIEGDVNVVLEQAFGRENSWIPEQTEEQGVVTPKLLKIGDNIDEASYNNWRETLAGFVETASHTVEIVWLSGDTKFQTVSVLGDTYPYI